MEFLGLDKVIKKLQKRADIIRSLDGTELSQKKVVLDTFLHTGKDEKQSAQFEADNEEVFKCMRKVFKITGDPLK